MTDQKKKIEGIKKVIIFLVLLGIGALAGFTIGSLAISQKASFFYVPHNTGWMILISFIPLYILTIAIHEGGHALAGVSQRFDFLMYLVGPFMFEKENEKWKFKWNKSVNLSGGLALCMPRDNENIIKRFAIYVAGGPLASFLSAGLFYFIYNIVGGTGPSYSSMHNTVAVLLLLYTFFSSIIFLATIIPMNAGGFHSDGARLIRILKGGDISKLEMNIINIFSKIVGGIRPRDYNVSEIKEAKNLSKKLEDKSEVYMNGFLFHHAFDNNDLDDAEIYLEEYLAGIDKVSDGFKSSLWLDAAWFYAYGKKDLEKANAYFGKFIPSAIIPKAQLLTVEASMLKLEGKLDEMHKKIDLAKSALPAVMDKGMAKALGDCLVILLE